MNREFHSKALWGGKPHFSLNHRLYQEGIFSLPLFLSVSAFVPGWQPPSAPAVLTLALALTLPPSLPPPGTRCVKASSGCHSGPFLGSTGLRVLQPPAAPGPLQP